MGKYELIITCESDLCVGDGSVYNSTVDTDICKNRYGFPFIPAKRIRGCLRECAQELNDWGGAIETEKLFGEQGNRRAVVRIGDALPDHYAEEEEFIEEWSAHRVLHPQNVLGAFSYIRTQTSIDNETGVADDTTLRTVRVANKGLVFRAPVEIMTDEASDLETCKTQLKNCCAILKSIGLGRTRGLGNINVSFVDKEEKPEFGSRVMKEHEELTQGATRLDYKIELLEPVILKSVNGEESNSMDYIEGAKILGIVAQHLRGSDEKGIARLLDGDRELFFSNAYIMSGGRRLYEAPGYLQSVKNDDTHYRNRLYYTSDRAEEMDKDEDGNPLQINRMKHCYVLEEEDGSLVKKNVDMEERYHHKRPEDKSIGRAMQNAEGETGMYQISSVRQGQCFGGFITGKAESIAEIYHILEEKPEHLIGYGRSSEYGRVMIRVTGSSVIKENTKQTGNRLVVTLRSPAIVYNEKALCSTDTYDLDEEIRAALALPQEARPVEHYIQYTDIGGFNVTWGMRKPVLHTFDKGSAVVFEFDTEKEIEIPAFCVIGERTQEGFGEIDVRAYRSDEDSYTGDIRDEKTWNHTREDKLDVSKSKLAQAVCKRLFDNYIRSKAATAAGSFFKNKDKYRPTLSNMILICEDLIHSQRKKEPTGGGFLKLLEETAEERYSSKSANKLRTSSSRKMEKKEMAKEMVQKARENSSTVMATFCKEYAIEGFDRECYEVEADYMTAFLTFGKYALRQASEEDGGDKR